MLSSTGYTPEAKESTRLRNEVKACIQNFRAVRKLPGGGAHTTEAQYWWSRSRNAIGKLCEYRERDNATLQARAAQINEALEECLDQTAGMALLEELAEIENRLARDGERMDDYADYRRETIKFHQPF